MKKKKQTRFNIPVKLSLFNFNARVQ